MNFLLCEKLLDLNLFTVYVTASYGRQPLNNSYDVIIILPLSVYIINTVLIFFIVQVGLIVPVLCNYITVSLFRATVNIFNT